MAAKSYLLACTHTQKCHESKTRMVTDKAAYSSSLLLDTHASREKKKPERVLIAAHANNTHTTNVVVDISCFQEQNIPAMFSLSLSSSGPPLPTGSATILTITASFRTRERDNTTEDGSITSTRQSTTLSKLEQVCFDCVLIHYLKL